MTVHSHLLWSRHPRICICLISPLHQLLPAARAPKLKSARWDRPRLGFTRPGGFSRASPRTARPLRTRQTCVQTQEERGRGAKGHGRRGQGLGDLGRTQSQSVHSAHSPSYASQLEQSTIFAPSFSCAGVSSMLQRRKYCKNLSSKRDLCGSFTPGAWEVRPCVTRNKKQERRRLSLALRNDRNSPLDDFTRSGRTNERRYDDRSN